MKSRQAPKRSNRDTLSHRWCSSIRGPTLDNLAETFGTPSYIYSAQTIASNYHAFEHAFRELEPLICYAVKANANLSILAKLASLGSGFDIVSGGELAESSKPAVRLSTLFSLAWAKR